MKAVSPPCRRVLAKAIKAERALWLREHPGKTAKDYARLSNAELIEWREAYARADDAAERAAWERDHPGQQYPEHLCGLSDKDYVAYERWRKRQSKRPCSR